MKLHEGVYENLITGQLQASMNQTTDEGLGAIQIRLIDYICSRDDRPMRLAYAPTHTSTICKCGIELNGLKS